MGVASKLLLLRLAMSVWVVHGRLTCRRSLTCPSPLIVSPFGKQRQDNPGVGMVLQRHKLDMQSFPKPN